MAAIARWRHSGALIDLTEADAYQVVFNVSGGQTVDRPEREGSRRKIRAGTVGINSPGETGLIRVSGQAETLQILLSADLIRIPENDATAANFALAATAPELQAAAVQALVALETRTRAAHRDLERIVFETAKRFVSPPRFTAVPRGGLSPGARRRVCEAAYGLLADPSTSAAPVKDLSSASGLSLYHFIRSFHRTEGQTPYAWLLSARLNHALELLLRTEASIGGISDVTGFSSSSHLVSTFKKRMGVTPGVLRLAARKAGVIHGKSAIS